MNNTERLYQIQFRLNGERRTANVSAEQSLLALLRQDFYAWEVKEGCGKGDCGSCAVLVDGRVRLACLMLAAQIDRTEMVTVRGLGDENHLHPLQESFLQHGAVQCGFCTPGMLMAAKALLDSHPHPTRAEIRAAIAGNLCRCTGYQAIVDAIEAASRQGLAGVGDDHAGCSREQHGEMEGTRE